jgi:hypothetical protein
MKASDIHVETLEPGSPAYRYLLLPTLRPERRIHRSHERWALAEGPAWRRLRSEAPPTGGPNPRHHRRLVVLSEAPQWFRVRTHKESSADEPGRRRRSPDEERAASEPGSWSCTAVGRRLRSRPTAVVGRTRADP